MRLPQVIQAVREEVSPISSSAAATRLGDILARMGDPGNPLDDAQAIGRRAARAA